ncbi:MAG: small multi-drug export protein [Acetobacteraceae bacterium]|nr:small multi-drug export protein [Acetobacteraceae bacterium]
MGMDALLDWVRGLRPETAVLVLAVLPVVELRGAIPAGMLLGMNPWAAWGLALLGSSLPVPLVLWLGRPVARALKAVPGLRRIVARGRAWAVGRARGGGRMLERWGLLGLALFVAVPLPTTGAWTGALVAALLGVRPWPAFFAIAAGSAAAGLAVMLLTWLGVWTFERWP